MKAVILAGGEGTRLRPLTCNIPKPMVPILNTPFLEHMIGYLQAHRVSEVILALSYLPGSIQEHFGDGSAWGIRLTYVVEKTPLGTAGAVKNAAGHLDDTFLVFNGDTFTDIDLTSMIAFHRQRHAVASIVLTPVSDPTRYGVVEMDHQQQVQCFTEKPARDQVKSNLINAGIYVLEPDVLGLIPSDAHYMFERGLFPDLLERGQRVCGYSSSAYWVDIGTVEDYLRLHHDLLMGRAGLNVAKQATSQSAGCHVHPTAEIQGPVLMGDGCYVGSHSRLIGPVVMGPGCTIGSHAVIEGAVLWQGVSLGAGVNLRNCILASNCQVDDGGWVVDGCVLGDNVFVGQGNKLCNGTRLWPDQRLEPGAISI